jgi:hypothetical protein
MTARQTHPALNAVWDGVERRSGQDRRTGADRRSGIDRRSGLGFRPDPDRRVGANDNTVRCPWGNPDRRAEDRRRAAAG